MKYNLIRPYELNDSMVQSWNKIITDESVYASPFFSPDFTRTVASVRDDVYVGVLEEEGSICGFFPFQKSKNRVARPVGLGLSDYHGVVLRKSIRWSVEEMLKALHLIRWEFDHLISEQAEIFRSCNSVTQAPIIRLGDSFEKYVESLDKNGRKQYREVIRKLNKLEDRYGPVSFSHQNSDDENAFYQLIQWKSEQCRQTGTVDYFAIPWCRDLITSIYRAPTKYFGGFLSCIHIGKTLIAAHFGMYTQHVWHSWIPAYNHEFQEFSPGLILLYRMIQEAVNKKVKYIDLGKGASLYKKRVMNDANYVAQGSISLPAFRNSIHDYIINIEKINLPDILKPLISLPVRAVRRYQRLQRYQ